MTPKQRRDRVHQVGRYLREKYPLVYPVTIRVEACPLNKDGTRDDEGCWQTGKRFTIRVTPANPVSTMIHSLIHGWAHLRMAEKYVDWAKEEHSDPYWLLHGPLYRDMIDGDGWEDSKEY